jgi:diacylglycerol O-acyltransferase
MTQAETDAGPHRVHGVDAAFLQSESRTTPWQIVGVLVFDPSTSPTAFDRNVVAAVIDERLDRVEAFRRRVVDVRGVLSLPHWVLDRTVDLAEHVQTAELPEGGGLAGLARLAGDLAGFPLPRDRPLWRMNVVRDIGDGRAAVVAKVHHSIMDGAAAVGILGALFDLEPTPPSATAVEPVPTPPAPSLGVRSLVHTLSRMPVIAFRTAAQLPAAATGFARALRSAGRSVTLPLSGPRTVLNRAITAKRSIVLTTLPRADIRDVADSFGLTINDVLMTACAGALRRWLEGAGELPRRPLVAAVPVALRGGDEHQSGNRVSVMFVSLPTHLSDAAARVEAVRREMRDAKATHADVRPQTLGALADAAPWNVVGWAFRAYSGLRLANRLPPAVNLIVSNVPGPPVPVYCGGARLTALYPLGPIFDGAALNVTFATYEDQVDVGVVTCPDVAPPLDGLVSAFDAALGELVALARVPPRTEP